MSFRTLSARRLLLHLPPHHSPAPTLILRNLSLSVPVNTHRVFIPCLSKLLAVPHPSLYPTPHLSTRHTANLCPTTGTDSPTTPDLDKVANLLSLDLANVFLKKINIPLYHPEVVLEDRIRGQTFNGLILYIKNMHLLKIVAHIKFVYVRPHIVSLTKHPEDNTIRVTWKLVGLGVVRMMLRYFPDQLWLRSNMDKAALTWYEGYSTFHVNSEGKIVKHVVDKRTEEENKQTVKQMREKVSPSHGAQLKI
eukprot:GFUD01108235.1.p1 GENE.GFUD01108235.1~~GFUD01108235.1.p1  ORF type:complete len:250 (+),score=69.16 GFUD01108235.1:34-783(+)